MKSYWLRKRSRHRRLDTLRSSKPTGIGYGALVLYPWIRFLKLSTMSLFLPDKVSTVSDGGWRPSISLRWPNRWLMQVGDIASRVRVNLMLNGDFLNNGFHSASKVSRMNQNRIFFLDGRESKSSQCGKGSMRAVRDWAVCPTWASNSFAEIIDRVFWMSSK